MAVRFLRILAPSFLRNKLLMNNIERKVQPFSTCSVLLKNNFRSPNKFSKRKNVKNINEDEDNRNDDENNHTSNLHSNLEYEEMVDRTFRVPEMGHNILVIQPYIKWGANKKRNTTPDLQLSESVALIKTLNMWTVADKLIISLLSLDKSTFFGQGNLEKLRELVSSNKAISAVFISVDILKGVQRSFLENLFKVPVYDRYTIVLQIFREHAISREAKLQLKLAEIPYLRGSIANSQPGSHFTGSGGETYLEFQHNILKEKEKKIRSEIETLRSQRDLLRRKRRRSHMIVVAVVGYTNAGKTSLIKALTGEENLIPRDVLFATLDVTVHKGYLPSGLKVLYVDTIGFISDIPTTLLESFVATLEDALLADVIIHVRDASHPDAAAQKDHVIDTLKSLNLSEEIMSNIVEAGNKVDLVTNISTGDWTDCILVSAVKQKGLEELKCIIEKAVLSSTGLKPMDVRVLTGGEEFMWLQRESTVSDIRADEKDPQYCFMSVIIAPHVLAKFKHHFIGSRKKV